MKISILYLMLNKNSQINVVGNGASLCKMKKKKTNPFPSASHISNSLYIFA